MKRRLLLGSALAAAAAAAAVRAQGPATAGASDERLRALMQARGAAPATPSPERLREREALLSQGEAALAALDTDRAQALFDRAALILHAADTEMGLVRCYMQAGSYRRALAFGAHTAGAHLDVIGGTALYAWLLHAGGQRAVAGQMLARANERAPLQPLLQSVSAQLGKPWPLAQPELLLPPIRLAPYAQPLGRAAVVATGTVVSGGRSVLASVAALRPGARYWARNGLGHTVALRVAQRWDRLGLAELAPASPLPDPELLAAERAPFPGSVAQAVEFAPDEAGRPAWPLLTTGFVGAPLDAHGWRRLGVGLPARGLRGGPVLDARGRLAGIALPGPDGDRLLGVTRLPQGRFAPAAAPASAAAPSTAGVDVVYEQALRSAVQLLRRPG